MKIISAMLFWAAIGAQIFIAARHPKVWKLVVISIALIYLSRMAYVFHFFVF